MDLFLPQTCLGCRECAGCLVCESCQQGVALLPHRRDDIPGLDAVFSFYPYQDLVKTVLLAYKMDGLVALGPRLSGLCATGLDDQMPRVTACCPDGALFVPVPIHQKRYKRRGFNQSDTLFETALKARNAAYQRLARRCVNTPTLYDLSPEKRREVLKNAFEIQSAAGLEGKAIVLVDDILTTGATLSELALTFKRYGVSSVYGLTFSYAT